MLQNTSQITLFQPSHSPKLFVATVENTPGRVHLLSVFLDYNAIPTKPHHLRNQKRNPFQNGIPDGPMLPMQTAEGTALGYGQGSLAA